MKTEGWVSRCLYTTTDHATSFSHAQFCTRTCATLPSIHVVAPSKPLELVARKGNSLQCFGKAFTILGIGQIRPYLVTTGAAPIRNQFLGKQACKHRTGDHCPNWGTGALFPPIPVLQGSRWLRGQVTDCAKRHHFCLSIKMRHLCWRKQTTRSLINRNSATCSDSISQGRDRRIPTNGRADRMHYISQLALVPATPMEKH
jgi:hypothetical protein